MSDSFDRAIAFVLEHEGAYVEDPHDNGGATMWGISLRLLRELPEGDVDRDGDVDADDVRHLPRDLAIEIYRRTFWDNYRYFRMPEQVGAKVFDLAVNAGPAQAHRLLQRALRACCVDVAEDGILGPETLRGTLIAASPVALVAALRSEAAGFYRLLVARRPALERFEAGWLRRAYS